MKSVELCLKQTISFKFKKVINSKRKSLYHEKTATFPMTSFICLIGAVDTSDINKKVFTVHFKAKDGNGVETFEINSTTFEMLSKVFFKHNLHDSHVGSELSYIFEPLNYGKVTVKEQDIKNVTCETHNDAHKTFKLTTKRRSYEISQEDYNFLEKSIISGSKESVNNNDDN